MSTSKTQIRSVTKNESPTGRGMARSISYVQSEPSASTSTRPLPPMSESQTGTPTSLFTRHSVVQFVPGQPPRVISNKHPPLTRTRPRIMPSPEPIKREDSVSSTASTETDNTTPPPPPPPKKPPPPRRSCSPMSHAIKRGVKVRDFAHEELDRKRKAMEAFSRAKTVEQEEVPYLHIHMAGPSNSNRTGSPGPSTSAAQPTTPERPRLPLPRRPLGRSPGKIIIVHHSPPPSNQEESLPAGRLLLPSTSDAFFLPNSQRISNTLEPAAALNADSQTTQVESQTDLSQQEASQPSSTSSPPRPSSQSGTKRVAKRKAAKEEGEAPLLPTRSSKRIKENAEKKKREAEEAQRKLVAAAKQATRGRRRKTGR